LSKVCSVSKNGIGFARILNSKHMIPMMTNGINKQNPLRKPGD